MNTIALQVNVPKEMQEISLFIQHLVKAIKDKKSVAEIAAAELGELMTAIEGFDQIRDELKSPEAYDCIALLGAGVFKALKD